MQPDAPTVQGALLEAAHRFLGPDARVIGASRTDAGVHALRQAVSLRTTATLAASAVQAALNAALPPSVRVLERFAQDLPQLLDPLHEVEELRDAPLGDDDIVVELDRRDRLQ